MANAISGGCARLRGFGKGGNKEGIYYVNVSCCNRIEILAPVKMNSSQQFYTPAFNGRIRRVVFYFYTGRHHL